MQASLSEDKTLPWCAQGLHTTDLVNSMTGRTPSGNVKLPIMLAVATGHEAGIVQRSVSSVATVGQNNFEVIRVGVGCSTLDTNRLGDTCSAIVSVGFAGALKPGIKSGTLLVPGLIRKSDNTAIDVDASLQKMITQPMPEQVVDDSLLHTDRMLVTTAEKHSAFEHSGCAGCDMESGTLALAGEKANRPFACLRVVLDPASMTIPAPIVSLANAPASASNDPSGTEFLKAILRQPGQLPATATFLWHTFVASRALSQSVTRFIKGCCE